METLIILVKLLCAHLCSDFILQTDKINSGKRKPGLKGISYLILHSITHACIAYMLVANWSCWQIPAIVFISHFINRFGQVQVLQGIALNISCRPVFAYRNYCSIMVHIV